MRVLASSFGSWESIEEQEGIKVPHGITFPLAVVESIGIPHGLVMTAEENVYSFDCFDAVFVSVMDSRCMIPAKKHFDKWGIPFFRRHRSIGDYPLIWAGGQGLRNPLPLADVYDLCVIGDAEVPLPILLNLWEKHGNTKSFLVAASLVEGVFVPSIHNRRLDTVTQSVASDISSTTKNSISVSHDGSRRIEIARGCKNKCGFCSLGWLSKYRENSLQDIIESLKSSPVRVHLQSGDAEAHSCISEIREFVESSNKIDLGWTGRLDSLLDNPDQKIPGHKRYALGVEGMSCRIRNAIGKGYITNELLVSGTVNLFSRMGENEKGRLAWHMIAGLPGTSILDSREIVSVIREIDRSIRCGEQRNLSMHWQPFQPLPGTPMQWFAAGVGAKRESDMLSDINGLSRCRVRQVIGRSDNMAILCSVLSRSDERGALLLQEINERRVTIKQAEEITGSTSKSIDVDCDLPWDFVKHQYGKETLKKAHAVIVKKLNMCR